MATTRDLGASSVISVCELVAWASVDLIAFSARAYCKGMDTTARDFGASANAGHSMDAAG
jgi:hypothetical protein